MQRALVAVLLGAGVIGCGDAASPTQAVDASTPFDAADGADGGTAGCLPPRTMCGSVCTDLATDPGNCGTCGHVCGCGSTTCTAGLCDAQVLADTQSDPTTLAYYAGNLYWDNNISVQPPMTNVMTMSADGTITAKALYTGRTAIRGFAFDATRIYFTRSAFSIVESGTLTGTSSGNYTNAQENGPAGIATDGSNVFWANGGATGVNPSSIRRAANGAPVQTGTSIAVGQAAADGIALDATSVYWTTNDATAGGIHKLAKTATAGTTPTDLAVKQAHPHSITVSGTYVYWANQGDGVNNTGSINRVPVTGGAPTVLASGLSKPMTLAVQGDSVFWTDGHDGTISKVPLAGGVAPVIIVAHQAAPNGLVTSSSCLYFADEATKAVGTGSIRVHDLR